MRITLKKLITGLTLMATITMPSTQLSDTEKGSFQNIITTITTGINTQKSLLPRAKTVADVQAITDTATLKYKPGADTGTAIINGLTQINTEKNVITASTLSDDFKQKFLKKLNTLTEALDDATAQLANIMSPTIKMAKVSTTLNTITNTQLPSTLNSLATLTAKATLTTAQAILATAKSNLQAANQAVAPAQKAVNNATNADENLATKQTNAATALSNAQQQLASAVTKKQQQNAQNAVTNATALVTQLASQKALADQAVANANAQLAPLLAAQTSAQQAFATAQQAVNDAKAALQQINAPLDTDLDSDSDSDDTNSDKH